MGAGPRSSRNTGAGDDGDGSGWGPCREKGCLPDGEQSTGLGELGTGNRLESQWVVVTAAVGEVDRGWVWGKEEVQSQSWRYWSKDQKLKCLMGPGQSPVE